MVHHSLLYPFHILSAGSLNAKAIVVVEEHRSKEERERRAGGHLRGSEKWRLILDRNGELQ